MNEEAKWFEPVPELEGDITEVNDATLQAQHCSSERGECG